MINSLVNVISNGMMEGIPNELYTVKPYEKEIVKNHNKLENIRR